MEDARGSPARRLSQILDPIVRLTGDYGGSSSSAPCSPHMGVRSHVSNDSMEPHHHEVVGITRSSSRNPPPPPPPRPRNNSCSSANPATSFHPRDYVNLPPNHQLYNKDSSSRHVLQRSFTADSPKGYLELAGNSSRPVYSPFDFSSESSGRVEYADRRNLTPDLFDSVAAAAAAPVLAKECEARRYEVTRSRSDRRPLGLEQNRRFMMDEQRIVAEARREQERNWQERCMELQLELHRSKTQAIRIRDILHEKVSFFLFCCFE